MKLNRFGAPSLGSPATQSAKNLLLILWSDDEPARGGCCFIRFQ
jgi:hypothetical protein